MLVKRDRRIHALLILIVIVSGLASRSAPANHLPAFIGAYAGDTLWALMVYLLLGFLFPALHPRYVALLTIAVSFGVELSQLYQADWLNAIRRTRLGALTLGAGFLWSDLLCYSVGTLLGLTGESLAERWKRSAPLSPTGSGGS